MKWIRIWTQQTIFGTTFTELNCEQRGVWFSLLALAGYCNGNGRIEVVPGVAYTVEQIAKMLKMDVTILKNAIKHLETTSKIYFDGATLVVTNWCNYQTEYDRQKGYRHSLHPQSIREQEYKRIREQENKKRQTAIAISPEAKEAFDYYKLKIQPGCRPLDKHLQKIMARLKTYKLSELKIAVDKFAANTWWMEKNAGRGASWFFGSDDRVEKSMNIEPEKIKKQHIPPENL